MATYTCRQEPTRRSMATYPRRSRLNAWRIPALTTTLIVLITITLMMN